MKKSIPPALILLAYLLGFGWSPVLSSTPTSSNPEILIEWSNTSQLNSRVNFLRSFGASKLKTFQTPLMRRRNRGFIEKVSIPAGTDVESTLRKIRETPGVVTAEVNQRYKTLEISNDPSYTNGSLWGMYSNDATPVGPSGTTNTFGSQAEQAWGQGFIGDTKIVIGVIDTGVDYTHPDLYLNIFLNQGEIKTLPFFSSLQDVDGDGLITFRDLNSPANSSRVSDLNSNGRIDAGDLLNDARWENGVDNDGNGLVDDLVGWDFINGDNDPMDDNYHGTHVAGTIGAIGGNSLGVTGVNWKIQIVPLKFLDSGGGGFTDDAIQCIDYYSSLTQDYDVAYNPQSPLIFMGTNNSWGGVGFSSLLQTSIRNSALVNNHFFAAAGNDSTNNNQFPFYPANYTTVGVAGWEAVTSVASIDSDGSLSDFSNYGSTAVDIGGPGSEILSTAPDNDYYYLSGTSMATPHIAGAMALFASVFPQVNRREFRDVLLTTSNATPSLNGKVASNGRLDILSGLVELSTRYPADSATYSITGPNSVDEGSTVTLSISTTGIADGVTLYWGITGVQQSDITGGTQGEISISGGSGSVSFSLINDNSFEGPENLIFRLYNNPSRLIQKASKSLIVNDTSNGVTYIWGTTGSETLSGTDGRNVITGVPSSGVTPQALGKGQRDIVYGRGGADVFLLGQIRDGIPRVFYNNGVSSNAGATDQLVIMDFNKNVDKLQFISGAAGRYFTRNATTNTVVYWDRNNDGSLQLSGGSRDEVIAVLRRVNLGSHTITNVSPPTWAIF